jgi:hypothetical protein
MTTRILELEVSLEIRKAIESKQLNTQSAMAIIKKGMELMEKYNHLSGKDKKDLLIKVLENISAGNDGIIGTDDDILPQETVLAMKTILDGKLVGDIIDTIVSAVKGDIDMKKVAQVAQETTKVVKGFMSFLPCFKPKTVVPEKTQPQQQSALPVVATVPQVSLPVIKAEDIKIKVITEPVKESV